MAGDDVWTAEEIGRVLDGLPVTAFGGRSKDQQVPWVQHVMGVDSAPKQAHPVLFYAAAARLLAEAMGTTHPMDYEESAMADHIRDVVQPRAQPFDQEGEPPEWRAVIIFPAHVALCLRVQHRAQMARSQRCAAEEARAAVRPDTETLTQTMEKYMKMETEKVGKGKLSFDIQAPSGGCSQGCASNPVQPRLRRNPTWHVP